MNKEEAIEDLQLALSTGNYIFTKSRESLRMAISALKEEPAPFDFELFQAGLMDIPDGMTNGEVIQALFPYVEIVGGDETFIAIRIDSKKGVGTPIALYAKWWNAPYKKEGE